MTTTNQSTLFDQIPNDIHDQIARHLLCTLNCDIESNNLRSLKDDQYLETLFHYCQNYPVHRRSIMKLLSFQLSPTIGWREKPIVNWISIFANELLELDLSESPRFSFPNGFPQLSKLRRASIKAVPEHISLIEGSKNLEGLTVKLKRSSFWDILVSGIASLPLKYLNINFEYLIDKGPNELSKIDFISLCAACPAVEHLFLRGAVDLLPLVWEAITGFRSLKKIGLHAEIEDHHLPFLQTMSEVEIYELSPGAFQRVQSLRTRVTGLHLLRTIRHEEIIRLGYFSNLRVLSITPSPCEESILIGMIDNVEELSLSWGLEYLIHIIEFSRERDIQALYPAYHEPNGEMLVNI